MQVIAAVKPKKNKRNTFFRIQRVMFSVFGDFFALFYG
jgi:hypothetical protein